VPEVRGDEKIRKLLRQVIGKSARIRFYEIFFNAHIFNLILSTFNFYLTNPFSPSIRNLELLTTCVSVFR